MKELNLYKSVSLFLIFAAIFSFFAGFYFDESSTGAAGYDGDFEHIYNNLKFFLNHDLITSITNPAYHDSRPPTPYILHEMLNPFVYDEINYRRTVFFISLLCPIIFYFCLKQNFKSTEKLLLILLSSTLLLSPYFRTSSFWGIQENYGLLFLLLSFLLLSFLNEEKDQTNFKEYVKIFTITLVSSLCIYFDQKLLIIPIICFLKIIYSKKSLSLKIFSIFCYFIFSLPYIYFITIWGSIIPSGPSEERNLGETLYLEHFGYALTMIAFYLLPVLFFKGEKVILLIKNFFLNKNNYFLIIFFFLYLIYLLIFVDFNKELLLGSGFVNKISNIMFSNSLYKSFFIYFSFFISWIIVLIYFDKNFYDFSILAYFLILSVIIWPIFQEYFDPLIIIFVFTFFSSKIYLTYKNLIILFAYLSIFLIGTNIYYSSWLN